MQKTIYIMISVAPPKHAVPSHKIYSPLKIDLVLLNKVHLNISCQINMINDLVNIIQNILEDIYIYILALLVNWKARVRNN